ncbi:hypothetical protein NL676_007300 [Syzygium grande]|nr:hypothetical protein NL676_007300 [Syzygium grande]
MALHRKGVIGTKNKREIVKEERSRSSSSSLKLLQTLRLQNRLCSTPAVLLAPPPDGPSTSKPTLPVFPAAPCSLGFPRPLCRSVLSAAPLTIYSSH